MRLRLARYPGATLAELQVWLEATHTVIISVEGVSEVLVEIGKKSLHAAELDTVEGEAKRAAWREQLAGIAPGSLVFLDESGVREGTPGGHWQTATIL